MKKPFASTLLIIIVSPESRKHNSNIANTIEVGWKNCNVSETVQDMTTVTMTD